MLKSKIVTHHYLLRKVEQVRTVSKTVVMCYGTFDLYHAGHVDLLEQAKQLGDMLIVIIEEKEKGNYSMIYNKEHRMRLVSSHECGDYITDGKIHEIIEMIKPDIMVTSFIGDNPPHKKSPVIAKQIKEYGGKFISLKRNIFIDKDEIISKIFLDGGF